MLSIRKTGHSSGIRTHNCGKELTINYLSLPVPYSKCSQKLVIKQFISLTRLVGTYIQRFLPTLPLPFKQKK